MNMRTKTTSKKTSGGSRGVTAKKAATPKAHDREDALSLVQDWLNIMNIFRNWPSRNPHSDEEEVVDALDDVLGAINDHDFADRRDEEAFLTEILANVQMHLICLRFESSPLARRIKKALRPLEHGKPPTRSGAEALSIDLGLLGEL